MVTLRSWNKRFKIVLVLVVTLSLAVFTGIVLSGGEIPFISSSLGDLARRQSVYPPVLRTPPTPPLTAPVAQQCSCPTFPDEVSGTFLKHPIDLDTCQIVCASTWTLQATTPWGTYLGNESNVVENGYKLMEGKKLAICIIMQNRHHLIKHLRQAIDELSPSFQEISVFVHENDSREELRNELRYWQLNLTEHPTESKKKTRVHVSSHQLLAQSAQIQNPTGGTVPRFHMFSVMRNECLMEVGSDEGAPYDILMSVDLDDDLKLTDLSSHVAHSFGLKANPFTTWNVMCANGVYDGHHFPNEMKDFRSTHNMIRQNILSFDTSLRFRHASDPSVVKESFSQFVKSPTMGNGKDHFYLPDAHRHAGLL